MELTWTPLADVPAAADGSAYAEFWLYAPGSPQRQLALAGVVAHIGPVLEELVRGPGRITSRPPHEDLPQAAK